LGEHRQRIAFASLRRFDNSVNNREFSSFRAASAFPGVVFRSRSDVLRANSLSSRTANRFRRNSEFNPS
jgi:hypothetical protein